jgi:hypothetical protein
VGRRRGADNIAIVRTLHADLLAAQQQPTRRPVVELRVRNLVSGIERYDFAELSLDPTLGDRHGAAVAGTDVLIRARASGGTVSVNRVADPTGASDFSTWTSLATGMGGQCAIAARADVVVVAYVDAAGTGIKVRISINAAATWAAEEAAHTAAAAPLDLAVAIAPDGRIGIAWVTATQRHIIIRSTGGSWGSVSSDTPAGSPTLARVGMAYGFDWNMVLTGADSGDRRTLWTALHGDGAEFSAGSWSTLRVQQQADDGAQVEYSAPFLMFTDAFRLSFVEEQSFTGGQTRVLRSHLHPTLSYLSGDFTWTSAVPTDVVDDRGLALAAGSAGINGRAYETTPSVVRQASRAPLNLAAHANVLALELEERPHDYRGWIDLDNSGGVYAGPPEAIRPGNFVEVALGYETATGDRTSSLPDLHVTGWEYRRDAGVAVFRLLVASGWEQLRRSRQRAQIVHQADVTWVAVMLRIFLRAGLLLSSVNASARALAVQPRFTIHPSTSGYDAIRRAQDFVADHIRMAGLTVAQMVDPDPAGSSAYTFGADHPMQTYRLLETPPRIADVHVFADGAFGSAVDPDAAQHALGTRADLRDLSATTGAAAAETAEAHLRRRALDARAGHFVAQPNVGLQLFDVVTIAADELVHGAAVVRRVSGITWEYRRTPRGVYRHTVELAPV